ncbi:MAG: glycosyltransferase family 39 protein [Chloroflexota bacterium]
MSHDESLHTYFSWLLFQGNGYQHSPMMHGPLQFHLLALTFYFLSDSDFTARLPHALASILTIVMLWKWRRYLGRPGALIAASMLLASPFMLYYGRYARNEAFVALLGVVFIYSLLRYLETGKSRYIYLTTLATVLHFTVKETAFIYVAQALLFLAAHFIIRVTRQSWKTRKHLYTFLFLLIVGVALAISAIGSSASGYDLGNVDSGRTVIPVIPSQPIGAGTVPVPVLTISLWVGSAISLFAAFMILGQGFGWKRVRSERSFDLLLLLGTLVLPQLVAFPISWLGWDPLAYHFTWPGWDLLALSQTGPFRTLIALILIMLISMGIGIWWRAKLWLKNAGIFYGIYAVLYTTFFTNGAGFFTGIVGSLGYWIVQQGVERGSQPWYYYLLVQLPVYEFLAVFGFCLAVYYLIRGIRLPTSTERDADRCEHSGTENRGANDGNHTTIALLIWWSLSSLVAFSLAGEKMPWLTVHIALPMILISGWSFGKLTELIDWSRLLNEKGIILLASVLIGLFSLLVGLNTLLGPIPPFQGKDLAQLTATGKFIAAFVAFVASLVTMIFLARKRWTPKDVLRIATLSFSSVLFVLTARTAIRAAYLHPDDATEYLVYAHGARGVKDIMEQIEALSTRTGEGNNLLVAYDASPPDTGVSWPFTWYLRNYPNKMPFSDPTHDLREAPVIIVDPKNFTTIRPVVGDEYYRMDYLRMVWPNQDYFNLTWERITSDLKNPRMIAALFQIWFNRDYDLYAEVTGKDFTLSNWTPSDAMQFYIRRDDAAQVWDYGIGTASVPQIDPYEAGTIFLAPDMVVGSFGQSALQFNYPRGLDIAPDGSIFVADANNHRIQHINPDGSLIRTWGTFADINLGDAPPGTFNEPWGVAVSPDNRYVYVADTWNHRVQKFTIDGVPVTSWGYANYGQTTDPYGFWGPRGIAVDNLGRVYVTDTGNKRFVVFDSNGGFIFQLGGFGFEPGYFDEPVGIYVGPDGIIYIADTWNQRIQSFNPQPDGLSFIPQTQWEIVGWYGQSLDNKPFITVDNAGNVYVTDPEMYRVLEFNSRGEFLHAWSDFGVGPSGNSLVSGIAVDDLGQLWVSDIANHRLIRFSFPGPINNIP